MSVLSTHVNIMATVPIQKETTPVVVHRSGLEIIARLVSDFRSHFCFCLLSVSSLTHTVKQILFNKIVYIGISCYDRAVYKLPKL